MEKDEPALLKEALMPADIPSCRVVPLLAVRRRPAPVRLIQSAQIVVPGGLAGPLRGERGECGSPSDGMKAAGWQGSLGPPGGRVPAQQPGLLGLRCHPPRVAARILPWGRGCASAPGVPCAARDRWALRMACAGARPVVYSPAGAASGEARSADGVRDGRAYEGGPSAAAATSLYARRDVGGEQFLRRVHQRGLAVHPA